MSAKNPESPATTSSQWDCMAPRWKLVDDLLGGTEALREAGEEYCPRHEEETPDGYAARLGAAVLLNVFEETAASLAGKPFTKEIGLSADFPKPIQEQILWDVDLQGNNLEVFSRKLFFLGLTKAFCHVLIDLPRPLKEAAPGKPRTLEDDRRENRRPYWILVQPERVLFAEAETVDGKEVLKHVRIKECYCERVGFAQVMKERIRVLEPGSVQLWEPHPTKKGKDGEPEWVLEDEWLTGLDYIPLVTFYARRDDFMEAKPPLLDLAYLNITHWQSTSDQRHILRVARFPILACSGAHESDSQGVVIGPNKILYNPDPQGKFYYVEHTGAAIEAGRKDLEDLGTSMSSYGAEFLKERPGGQTATASAIDSAAATSALASMVGVFEDALAQVLSFTAMMMGLGEYGGKTSLVKKYDSAVEDARIMPTLQATRTAKDLSRTAYLNILKDRGYLPPDFDPEVDAELLSEEAETAMALAMAGMDLDPAASPPEKEGREEGEA